MTLTEWNQLTVAVQTCMAAAQVLADMTAAVVEQAPRADRLVGLRAIESGGEA